MKTLIFMLSLFVIGCARQSASIPTVKMDISIKADSTGCSINNNGSVIESTFYGSRDFTYYVTRGTVICNLTSKDSIWLQITYNGTIEPMQKGIKTLNYTFTY
jgi:hypothetical protein